MGRDTVQLETAVSTITQEYLLEFTSEYGISEDLHSELPDRGDRIVDFPEGKISMYSALYTRISKPNKSGIDRPLVFGLRLFKTYDRGSLAAQEFHKKVHRDGSRGSNIVHYLSCLIDEDFISDLLVVQKPQEKIMLVHDKKPDLTVFRVFGALCYPINDSEDLGKLQLTADIGILVDYAPSRKGTRPTPTFLTLRQISSGLVPNPVPAAPYVPPTNKDLEILFQPMFDEYLEPPRVKRPVSPAPVVQVPVNSTGTPSSTTIDQDAPSLAESTLMEDNPFAPIDNDHFINMFAPEP
ncbi:hypothetical protein Tco_0863018, partial [Tanacetum coccineum]